MFSQLKKIIQKIVARFYQAKKPLGLVAIVIVMLMVIALYPLTAQAGWFSSIAADGFNLIFTGIAFVINVFIYLLGKLLTAVMGVLVILSQYNKFIDNPYVNEGWVILRDLVNMFFVLGLLFIAFVTVLKIEKYQWNKLLGRLLVMAIMVNFSKTICGVIIDFFQVVMITFVNAYKDITSGNILKALNVTDWFVQQSETTGGAAGTNDWKQGLVALSGSILGLIYVMITLVVVIIFCVILCFRMIALWILVVFSPLAFFAWSFEGAGGKVSSFANQWWDQFFNYCLVGPCIAFFLWISLITMVKLNYDQMFPVQSADRAKYDMNEIGRNARLDNLLSILLGIIMLVAGLQTCSKYAGAGAGIMTKAANSIKDKTAGRLERTATGIAGLPGRAVGAVGKGVGVGVGAFGSRLELRGGTLGSIARGARLLGTKKGRETLGERFEASAYATIGGQPGARVDQRQKEIDNQANMLKRAGADKDPAIAQKFFDQYKNKKDAMGMQAWLSVMGKEGKVTSENFHQAAGIGAFDHYGKVKMDKNGRIDMAGTDNNAKLAIEQQAKQWEKDFEEKNGFRRSFSPFIRDPITNDWLEVKPGEEGEKQKAKDSQKSIRTAGVEKMSKGLNNAQFANLGDSSAMEALYLLIGVGQNVSTFKRSGEPAQKNVQEKIEQMATVLVGPEKARNKLIDDLANEKKLTGKDREKFVASKKIEFASVRAHAGAEDIQKIQEAYIAATGKHIQGTGETEIQGNPNDKLAGLAREKQSDERMPYNLNFGGTQIALSRLHYQKIQQARKAGASDADLKKMLLANDAEGRPEVEKVQMDAEGKPLEADGKRIKVKITDAEANSIISNKDALDNISKLESFLPDLLRSTKDKGQMVTNANNLLGSKAGNIINLNVVIEDSMQNSSSILKQEELRKDLTINVTTQINKLNNAVKQSGGASEDQINKIKILMDSMINSVEQEATQTGYSAEYFNLAELKQALKDIEAMTKMKGVNASKQQMKAVADLKKKLAALDLIKEKTKEKK